MQLLLGGGSTQGIMKKEWEITILGFRDIPSILENQMEKAWKSTWNLGFHRRLSGWCVGGLPRVMKEPIKKG